MGQAHSKEAVPFPLQELSAALPRVDDALDRLHCLYRKHLRTLVLDLLVRWHVFGRSLPAAEEEEERA